MSYTKKEITDFIKAITGNLSSLTTADKSTLIAAINEIDKTIDSVNGTFSSNEIDIFIVAGQSNASGRGNSAEAPAVTYAEALKWVDSSQTFETFTEPVVGINDSSNTASAWGSFAKKYFALTGRKSAYILTSKGGTGIADWDVSGAIQINAINSCKDAILKAKADYNNINLAGILWCQGERDGIIGTSEATYKAGLLNIVNNYRSELTAPELPIFIFELGAKNSGTYEATYQIIRTAQNNFCIENRNAFMVFTGAKYFPVNGMMADDDHYTQAGYNLMGTEGANATASPASLIALRNRVKYNSDNMVNALPIVAVGEKVLTAKSDGLHVDYVLVDVNAESATSAASLDSADWSSGSVSLTGVAGEIRFYNGYKYECINTNVWYRFQTTYGQYNLLLDVLDDSAGVKTSAQMVTLYPSAVIPQMVKGNSGIYQYFGIDGWSYFQNIIPV